jgi:hypothetical protein
VATKETFPKKFVDDLGRSWTVDITVGTIKRVKAAVGFSFDDLVSDAPRKKNHAEAAEDAVRPLRAFLDDDAKFSDVLFAIVGSQNPDIDQSNFDDGMGGLALSLAKSAFVQALHDFFQKSPPKRMLVRGVMEQMQMMKRAETTANKKLAELMASQPDVEAITNQEIEKAMSEAIAERSSSDATNSPAPLALATPTA